MHFYCTNHFQCIFRVKIVFVWYLLSLSFASVKLFSFLKSIDVRSTKSRQIINRYGANVSPCSTPVYGRWLRQCQSASGKNTRPGRIPANSLEQAAGGIGHHVNADKRRFMLFNQRGDISTRNGGSLKLMHKFTYPGSSVSSTENDISTWLAKAWTAIDML